VDPVDLADHPPQAGQVDQVNHQHQEVLGVPEDLEDPATNNTRSSATAEKQRVSYTQGPWNNNSMTKSALEPGLENGWEKALVL